MTPTHTFSDDARATRSFFPFFQMAKKPPPSFFPVLDEGKKHFPSGVGAECWPRFPGPPDFFLRVERMHTSPLFGLVFLWVERQDYPHPSCCYLSLPFSAISSKSNLEVGSFFLRTTPSLFTKEQHFFREATRALFGSPGLPL